MLGEVHARKARDSLSVPCRYADRRGRRQRSDAVTVIKSPVWGKVRGIRRRKAAAADAPAFRTGAVPIRPNASVLTNPLRGMSRFLATLAQLPRLLLVGLIRTYQLLISPHLGNTCRFHPTCSQYAIEALREYGVCRGLVLTLYRLGRCHPWGGCGYDPPRWFGEAPAGTSPDPANATADDSD